MPRTRSETILAALIILAAVTYLWILSDLRLAQLQDTYGNPTGTPVVTEAPR